MQNVISKIKNFKIPKVTLLDKFILSQVLGATLVCLILFIIVWSAPETLFKIIKKILRNSKSIGKSNSCWYFAWFNFYF